MKKILTLILVTTLLSFTGGNTIMAKAKGKAKNDTVVFVLTPAPVCQNCVNKIKGNLRFERGVKDIDVNLDTKSVAITYTHDSTDSLRLTKALKKIGYEASPLGSAPAEASCCGSNQAK